MLNTKKINLRIAFILPFKKKLMKFLDFIILKLTLSIGLVEFKIIFKT
ncbi:hypothetical protein CLU81_0987 [Flavobacterium sp. 9]|nr:hypothetical protein CLU81_0987 [Flavobacterium sp. 9]